MSRLRRASRKRPSAAQQQVRRPHGDHGGMPPAWAHFSPGVQQHPVGDDHQDRQREAGRLAAAPVVEPEGQGEDPEHQAGEGDGELLVDLDPGQAPDLDGEIRVGLPTARSSARVSSRTPLEATILARGVLAKRSSRTASSRRVLADLVGVRLGQVDLVDPGVLQVEDHPLAVVFDPHLAALRDGHPVLLGRRHRLGQEHPVATARSPEALEDVEDLVLPFVEEHPGLDLARDVLGQGLQAA